MRIYLDSQIFRYLKSDYCKFKEFQDCLESISGSSVFPYSNAHLDDLSKNVSKPELTTEDLLFMEHICKNVYLNVDGSHDFHIYIAKPVDAYNAEYYETLNKFFDNPSSILSFVKDLEDSPEFKPLAEILELFLKTPVGPFISEDAYNQLGAETKLTFSMSLDGLKGVQTIEDFIKTTMFESGILFNNEEKFTEFKKYIQSKVDNAKFGYSALGMDFDEKLKDSPLAHTFTDILNLVVTENQRNDFYQIFNFAYLFLELLNISPDRTAKGKRKDSSFSNLSIDGNHAFFASHCDIFITNDVGLQIKAGIIFTLLGIPCKIMGSSDFVKYYYDNLNDCLTTLGFSKLIFSIKEDKQIPIFRDEHKGISFKKFVFDTKILNYFDTIEYQIEANIITLYKRKSAGYLNSIIYKEVEILITNLQTLFGIDKDQFGAFSGTELHETNYLRHYITSLFNIFLYKENIDSETLLIMDVHL